MTERDPTIEPDKSVEPERPAEPAPPAAPPAFVWETPGSAQPVGGGWSAGSGWSSGPGSPAGAMTSSELIDRSISIYRRGFLVLVGVAAVIQIPLAIVHAVVGQRIAEAVTPFQRFSGTTPTTDELFRTLQDVLPALAGGVLLIAVVGFIAGLLLSPALIATVARVNAGEPATIADAYRTALRRAPAIFVGSLVQGFVLLALFVAIIVVGALLDSAGLGGALVISLVVAFVAAVYVTIRWAVWTQVVVIEARDPLDALVRSWRLVGRSMWRTLAILFLTVLVTLVAGAILGVVGGLLGAVLPAGWRGIIPDVLAIVYVSWLPITMTLLFLDLRARREGVASAVPADASVPEPTPPAPATIEGPAEG